MTYVSYRMARQVRVVVSIAMACLAGCTASPYVRPNVPLAGHWEHGMPDAPTASTAQVPAAPFAVDARLAALMSAVLAQSRELASATSKVRQARILAGLADLARLPQPGATFSADRRVTDAAASTPRTTYQAGATVAYEADLWGRLRAEQAVAHWESSASVQDRDAVRISLLSTTATLYFRLGLIRDRTVLSEANRATAERVLQLVQVQRRFGAVSDLEVAEARQTVAQLRSADTQNSQDLVETRNALSVLLDGGSTVAFEPAGLPTYPVPRLPAGLPSSYLDHRPDLRAAEWRLRKNLAGIDATRASFYPGLSLTSSGAGSSSMLRNVLQHPSLIVSGAVALSGILQRGPTVDAARAGYASARLDFEQALLVAFTEVDNALSAQQELATQGSELAAQRTDAALAARLYEARYRAGAVALRDWLAAQDKERQARSMLLENRYARFSNAITLYKAVGGALD